VSEGGGVRRVLADRHERGHRAHHTASRRIGAVRQFGIDETAGAPRGAVYTGWSERSHHRPPQWSAEAEAVRPRVCGDRTGEALTTTSRHSQRARAREQDGKVQGNLNQCLTPLDSSTAPNLVDLDEGVLVRLCVVAPISTSGYVVSPSRPRRELRLRRGEAPGAYLDTTPSTGAR
jgi:hypothetical protein